MFAYANDTQILPVFNVHDLNPEHVRVESSSCCLPRELAMDHLEKLWQGGGVSNIFFRMQELSFWATRPPPHNLSYGPSLIEFCRP